MKYGFESAEEYIQGAQKKFSLLEAGILDGPSTRLLLINVSLAPVTPPPLTPGRERRGFLSPPSRPQRRHPNRSWVLTRQGAMDGLMPIEDSILPLEHGSPKEARFFSGALHMGYPMANGAVYPWMEGVMASAK